jgi:hypothetical protein
LKVVGVKVFFAKFLSDIRRRLVTYLQSSKTLVGTFGKFGWPRFLVLCLSVALSLQLHASPAPQPDSHASAHAWIFTFDNDILVPGHRDQDYTYGLSFTQLSPELETTGLSLNKPLELLDSWIGNQRSPNFQQAFSRELGVFGFTPEDISLPEANPNDRPYASLIYFSSTRDQVDFVDNLAWKTTLTLGVLGADLVGKLQREIHTMTSSETPQGWQNQISQGGELTGRYLIARQDYWDELSSKYEIKSTVQASVGYLTEVSWGMNIRRGKIQSPWAAFNPDLTSYGEKSSNFTQAKNRDEHYFWAGFAIKARLYNAFLQGQFRDSAVTYDRSDLRPFLAETWIGYTYAFKQGYRLSYVLRGHSSEIRRGAADRNLLWGGISVSRSI